MHGASFTLLFGAKLALQRQRVLRDADVHLFRLQAWQISPDDDVVSVAEHSGQGRFVGHLFRLNRVYSPVIQKGMDRGEVQQILITRFGRFVQADRTSQLSIPGGSLLPFR
jgi:hypothetical protein